MNAYALFEALILVLAFIASAGFALRRLAPNQWQRLFGATAANCSSSCSTCGGCSASEAPRGTTQNIRFHRQP